MSRFLRIVALIKKFLDLLPSGATLTSTPPDGVAATVEDAVPEDKLAAVEKAVDDLLHSTKPC